MRALVTGATGLVGSHLVRALRERGDAVRALVRDPERARSLLSEGGEIELVKGDLLDPVSLERAARGVEVVYHCAARVALPYQGDRLTIFRTNVEGTRNTLRAAEEAGVQRFVFVSSVAVYGDPKDPLVREDHPKNPKGPYAESKVLAEELVEMAGERGLATVILRPCVIYGPGDRNFLPQIAETLTRYPFPLVQGGQQPLDMVHARDVAQALVLAGTHPRAVGRTYNVTDGETHSLRELVEVFCECLGVRPRLLSLPYPLAWILAALAAGISRMVQPDKDPLISPAGVRAMARPHHYDITRIREELGYSPQVSLEAGLREAVAWYFSERDLSGPAALDLASEPTAPRTDIPQVPPSADSSEGGKG